MSGPEHAYLSVRGVSKHFGGLRAIDDVTFGVAQGEITGLIGANGAGKSTLLNVVSGVLKPGSGLVSFRGKDLTGRPSYVAARAGIARTFQDLRLFAALTVAENILACMPAYRSSKLIQSFFRRERMSAAAAHRLIEIMDFLQLTALADTVVSDASYGEQKLVALGRVLAADGDLILLDEPLSGLSDDMVEHTLKLVGDLATDGRTILIIDHNVEAILGFVNRVIVLDHGRVIADDLPAAISRDETVQTAYLGV